ncbi:MAG: glutamine amidotransferase [Myxococcota bacterium]
MSETLAWSGDLPPLATAVALVVAAASALLLLYELIRAHGRHHRGWVAVSGFAALALLAVAILRPVRVEERGASVGARLTLLVDTSRSMDLPADTPGGTRRAVLDRVMPELGRHFAEVRLSSLSFGLGDPVPIEGASWSEATPALGSDLSAALEDVARANDDLPQAVVVVTDGRLDRPGEERVATALRSALGELRVPVHGVQVVSETPADAAVATVNMAEAVVAHQPVTVRIGVRCVGGLSCDEVPVVVRELHHETEAKRRAAGTVQVVDGEGTVELEVTLDRAGKRILEVGIESPSGDEIAENDRRLVTVDVARDRIRLLHVAGRPTYDVRALRTWLKSDAAVDVVAFFILRTRDDQVRARPDELALIPFPVDELFTEHLPSFDAVVLQDFDARPYGLSKHLPALADYVRGGGGLIMVGGPDAFVSGNYARTRLADVLPISLRGIPRDGAIDLGSFVPRFTKAGRFAPVLAPMRALLGMRLPEMPGSNRVGPARDGATVLLEHPTLEIGGGAMPVLALGEYGSGRSIALTFDGSHQLLFSEFAQDEAGRAHGAFWDALLGWLMRDPRFEPATVSAPDGCIAGQSTSLRVRAVFADDGAKAELAVAPMGAPTEPAGALVTRTVDLAGDGTPAVVDLGPFAPGGYTATVRFTDQGQAAPSRYDFACEAGGREWADPRPDRARLEAIAETTGGVVVDPTDIASLPLPEAARVVAERRVRPLLPPWAWTLLAATCLGGHWIARRRAGLT